MQNENETSSELLEEVMNSSAPEGDNKEESSAEVEVNTEELTEVDISEKASDNLSLGFLTEKTIKEYKDTKDALDKLTAEHNELLKLVSSKIFGDGAVVNTTNQVEQENKYPSSTADLISNLKPASELDLY